MDIRKLNIVQLHQAIKQKQITIQEITEQVINLAQADNDSNFLLTLPAQAMIEQAIELDQNPVPNNFLYGIPYMVKDNYATKGIRTTASTKLLDNFIPTYSATIVDLLAEAKTIMAGKVALDELGLGGTGLYSAYGVIPNPWDARRLCGGSSSGSVYAVAKGYVPFATGTDTGDSIRKPASFTGVIGYKPTYGAMSRYGIFPYAPSLDHAGFFTRNVDDMAIVADVTIQVDHKDFTTQEIIDKDFYQAINDLNPATKFGYLKQVHHDLSPNLKADYEKFYEKLRAHGYTVEAIDFRQDLLEALAPIYMMISFSEAVSTISNLDGINFGAREPGSDFNEIMIKTRTEYLGEVVKRRFMVGSFNLKKENQEVFLNKAKKVRRLIVEALTKVYQQIDILVLPPATGIAPLMNAATEFEDESKQYLEDVLTLGNFSGMPSITIPFVEYEGMPIGINFNAAPHQDKKVLQAAKVAENIIRIKDKVVD